MSLPLFVYGTLATEGAQAHLLGGRQRRPGVVRGTLYELPAGYPALALRGDTEVQGEWLDPLPDALIGLLDVYEGVPEGLYRRIVVQVETPRIRFDAWAWVMDHPEDRGGRLLRSGRWRPVRRH